MASKKKGKSRGKNQKEILDLPRMILFSALAAAVLLSISLSFYYSEKDPPLLLFKEPDTTAADFQEKLRRVDRAIYECLYASGTPEKNVLFQEVKPKRINGQVWDFTALVVNYPQEREALGLLKRISEVLGALGDKGIEVKSDRKPPGTIVCRIHVQKFFTHKLTLSYPSYPAQEVKKPQEGKKPQEVKKTEEVKKKRARLAIIIDDVGHDPKIARSFIQMDQPLSLSVLPLASHTELIVKEAAARGTELLLHLPMEPKGYPAVHPGPGALFTGMRDEEIRRILREGLKQVPGARGVNHHMGSAFTEDKGKMSVVLTELKEKNLFYVDSRTTSSSTALELARDLGLPTAQRHVFLDNDLDPDAIKIQFEKLLSMARQSGAAIGIGHAQKETAEVLGRILSRLGEEFELVPVSDLVE